ncbi:MAG: CoA transferase [Dehalococcoidia bacterium]|nr:CoA transferase [Dehalococcoidia bacterium]
MTFNSPLVLSDLTVIDASQGISGPFCAKLLAGFGARVIKVEPPEGDYARRMGPFHQDVPGDERSGLFLYLNTSKESVTLNLGAPGGAALFRRLARRAAIVIESFAPGQMAEWGLGYAALASENPGLIFASITPFGQTGPYAHYQATEIIIQALSALQYPVGLPGREPLKIGGSPCLMTAGVSAFSAIMIALHFRDATGEGQFVDISAIESAAVSQIHASVHAQFGGENPLRRDSQLSRTKDGWINVGIQDSSWKQFCSLIGQPSLAEDERFSDMAARRKNTKALVEILEVWLADQEKEAVYHQLQSMRSIAGPVLTVADLVGSPQYQIRGYFRPVDHPTTGPIPYPGGPFTVAEQPWRMERAPLLGEHNELVFGEMLGLAKPDIARLRELGTV